ncbi:hypothetical protein [Actinophytocola sp.]
MPTERTPRSYRAAARPGRITLNDNDTDWHLRPRGRQDETAYR